MNPKISVIIAAYNAEKNIKETIESLINQYYENLEIIVINDGSSDSTGDILVTLKNKYSNLIIRNIKNNGVSNARNNGIDIATGEYISFLDADDIVEHDFFYDLYKESDSKLLICAKNVYDMYSSGNIIPWSDNSHLEPDFYKNRVSIYVWGKLYKKSFLDDNNIRFDTTLRIAEDFLFNIVCLSKLSFSDIKIVNNSSKFLYRITPESLSNKTTKESLKNRKQSAESIYQILKDEYSINDALFTYVKTYLKTISIKLIKENQFSLLFNMLKMEAKNNKLSLVKVLSLSLNAKDKIYLSFILLLISIIRIML
ncbi:glycosyltransferase family 2 protein [Photobacterium leiognathi]|uniref:glycosyltransferase family 2 protein n=1 Tax=Photobacterium leiognathi TaxID=553611 RepID=UPI003AF3EB58